MLNNFFVYGTLKEGEWNDRPWYRENRIGVKKGAIRGRIYAVASFPGLKLNDEESIVYGEVHTYPAEKLKECLMLMDGLEGYVEGREHNHYNRKVVTVTLESSKEVEAYVYEYAPKVHESLRILSGVWTPKSLDEVEARNKKVRAAGR